MRLEKRGWIRGRRGLRLSGGLTRRGPMRVRLKPRPIGKPPAKLFTHHLHLPLPAHVLVDSLQSTCIARSKWFQVIQSAKNPFSKNHRQLLPHSLKSWTSLKSQDLVDNGRLFLQPTWIHLRLVEALLLFGQRFGRFELI